MRAHKQRRLTWLKKQRKKVDVAVDWDAYFEGIKTVCPWSYADWHAGLIQVVETSTPMALGNHTARVYVVDIHHMDLVAYSEYLNLTREDEWFYSDPHQGGNSTPVSVLIQQSPERLEQIRQNLQKTNRIQQ